CPRRGHPRPPPPLPHGPPPPSRSPRPGRARRGGSRSGPPDRPLGGRCEARGRAGSPPRPSRIRASPRPWPTSLADHPAFDESGRYAMGRDSPAETDQPMRGPTGVMALVLAETTAGGVFFLFLTPLWNEVRRGFFYLTGAIILVTALATAGTAAAAQTPGDTDAHIAVILSLVTAGGPPARVPLA